MRSDPKSAKIQSSCQSLFALLRSVCVKACVNMLEIDPSKIGLNLLAQKLFVGC